MDSLKISKNKDLLFPQGQFLPLSPGDAHFKYLDHLKIMVYFKKIDSN